MSGLNGAGSVLAYSSRDSTRIVKHTFDAANIRTYSVTSKFSERNLSFRNEFVSKEIEFSPSLFG